MGRDGSRFQVLHRFNGSPEMKADLTEKIETTLNGVTVMSARDSDGGTPMSLVFGSEGLIYGFTENRRKKAPEPFYASKATAKASRPCITFSTWMGTAKIPPAGWPRDPTERFTG